MWRSLIGRVLTKKPGFGALNVCIENTLRGSQPRSKNSSGRLSKNPSPGFPIGLHANEHLCNTPSQNAFSRERTKGAIQKRVFLLVRNTPIFSHVLVPNDCENSFMHSSQVVGSLPWCEIPTPKAQLWTILDDTPNLVAWPCQTQENFMKQQGGIVDGWKMLSNILTFQCPNLWRRKTVIETCLFVISAKLPPKILDGLAAKPDCYIYKLQSRMHVLNAKQLQWRRGFLPVTCFPWSWPVVGGRGFPQQCLHLVCWKR